MARLETLDFQADVIRWEWEGLLVVGRGCSPPFRFCRACSMVVLTQFASELSEIKEVYKLQQKQLNFLSSPVAQPSQQSGISGEVAPSENSLPLSWRGLAQWVLFKTQVQF